MFGWPEPYADGADKKERYAQVEQVTNQWIAGLFAAALDQQEADDLARLSTAALTSLDAHLAG